MICSLARMACPIVVATLAPVGCIEDDPGVDLAEVTGIVTDGNGPVADASVEFCPAKGSPSFAKTDFDGRYELKYSADEYGAVVGPHSIVVTLESEGATPPGGGEEVLEAPAKTLAVPGQRDVASGENSIDIDLNDATPVGSGASQNRRDVLEPSSGRWPLRAFNAACRGRRRRGQRRHRPWSGSRPHRQRPSH